MWTAGSCRRVGRNVSIPGVDRGGAGGIHGRCATTTQLIVGGLYSEIALRNTRSKGTVYTRHQSKN